MLTIAEVQKLSNPFVIALNNKRHSVAQMIHHQVTMWLIEAYQGRLEVEDLFRLGAIANSFGLMLDVFEIPRTNVLLGPCHIVLRVQAEELLRVYTEDLRERELTC